MSKILQWSVVVLAAIVLVLSVQVARLPAPTPNVTVSLVNVVPVLPDVVEQVCLPWFMLDVHRGRVPDL